MRRSRGNRQPRSSKTRPGLKKPLFPRFSSGDPAIIKARGASSAAAAANAAVDTVRTLVTPTPAGDWYSVAICSDGSYGVEKGLMSSFPIRTSSSGREIVQGVPINDFSREKIDLSIKELAEERSLVSELLPK